MWLDAAPIIDRVRARGGLAWTLPHECPVPVGSADTSEFLRPLRPKSLCEPSELVRIRQAWRRMNQSGRVTLDTADWFCIDVLGLLPNEVYGDAWWQAVPDWDHDHDWQQNGDRWSCDCGDTITLWITPGGFVTRTSFTDEWRVA